MRMFSRGQKWPTAGFKKIFLFLSLAIQDILVLIDANDRIGSELVE